MTAALRPLVAALGCGILLAGCGGGGSADSTTASSPPAKRSATVNIASFKFQPATLTVATGAKVTFVNADKATHTATAQDKAFDTGDLRTSGRKTVTLAKAGTYHYFCVYHRFMEGEILVK